MNKQHGFSLVLVLAVMAASAGLTGCGKSDAEKVVDAIEAREEAKADETAARMKRDREERDANRRAALGLAKPGASAASK